MRSEFTQQQIQAANQQTINDYGFLGITVIGDASNQYNCHSYAWHLREGNSNRVWISNASQQIGACYDQTHNIDRYWTGGCFIQVCNESDADKVHYYCGDHSAVASNSNLGLFESKWGQLSVVRHTRTGVPYADPTNSVNYYANAKITGASSNLCTGTRVFNVKNISGATYSWTYSGTLSVIGPTNTNQITVQRNGSSNGAAWVEVSITTACSGSAVINRADFTVGAPQIEMVNFTNDLGGQGHWCSTHYNNLFSVEPAYLNNATFEARLLNYPSMTVFRTNSFANTGTDPFGYVPYGWYIIQLRTTNDCGTSTWYETEIEYVDCFEYGGGGEYFRITASPNPTSGDLNITIDKEKAEVKALSKAERVTYQLYNFNRTSIVKQWSFDNSQNQQKLNVQGLSSGQYVLVVTKGKYRQSTQIIIK